MFAWDLGTTLNTKNIIGTLHIDTVEKSELAPLRILYFHVLNYRNMRYFIFLVFKIYINGFWAIVSWDYKN